MEIIINPSENLKLGDFLRILNCSVEAYGNTRVRHKWQFNKEKLYHLNCLSAYDKARIKAMDELKYEAHSKFKNEYQICLITKELEKNFVIERGDDIRWNEWDCYLEKSFEICCNLTLQAEVYRVSKK
ncbi:TPA: hypothetical protein DCX66_00225 [Candidatus Nomurabacteria bacterium]|nr:MAG: hypothetical protein UR55_C0011G0039 [Candidatus Nomurabacteria bacterium GW2011_GWF1_34_20]KKP62875.1 MAG: hypothetical protein UR57_C0010G0039 [Candidatus Nomurabacteria bacterium GW2011_GWE2_34_25]HAE36701.1 hypothetical protein [Candidatus Nomurabacteria bacterium]HAX64895.1 hypothetical protein [Candidatus Nomurabacteria bacterium]HCU01646.1 hypothetical protein [Candidatus Nomurabacteria bacterium]